MTQLEDMFSDIRSENLILNKIRLKKQRKYYTFYLINMHLRNLLSYAIYNDSQNEIHNKYLWNVAVSVNKIFIIDKGLPL